MNFVCAHLGDIHLEEDHYFADTAQCLEWFVADAVQSHPNLFVVNGDLTTYKATIKERNVWVDMLIRMANQAPVLLVAGNHGAELEDDLYVLAKAKGIHPIFLCTEPEFIELDDVAIAVFPYPRKAGFVGSPEESKLSDAFVATASRVQRTVCTAARLFSPVLRPLRRRRGQGEQRAAPGRPMRRVST